jgi:hypothetical protein
MARVPRWLPVALSLVFLLSLALPAFAEKKPPNPCKNESLKLTPKGEVAVECNSDLWPLHSLNEEIYLDKQKLTLEDIKNKLNAGVKIKADVDWKDRNGDTLNTTKITARTVP